MPAGHKSVYQIVSDQIVADAEKHSLCYTQYLLGPITNDDGPFRDVRDLATEYVADQIA